MEDVVGEFFPRKREGHTLEIVKFYGILKNSSMIKICMKPLP